MMPSELPMRGGPIDERGKLMVATAKIGIMFADARHLHNASLESLAGGDVRDAAGKAWEATKRATDALILARLNIEPQKTVETTTELHRLTLSEERAEDLIGRYHINLGYLHQECSRLGLCDPVEAAADYIHETTDYIRDAEKLAEAKP